MYFFRTVSVNPRLPDRIGRLRDIAYNVWFSWNPRAQALFEGINQELWEHVNHNPVKFLLQVQQDELERIAADEGYLSAYDFVVQEFERYMGGDKWYQKKYQGYSDQPVAYFSAEFGLHESLPIYSGGLGLLSGDHAKAASDSGLPFVCVGLLYKNGYFTQRLNRDGWQEAQYPQLKFCEMPVFPATHDNGREVVIQVQLPGRIVHLKVWRMKVGLINIYFLDSDLVINRTEDRRITGQLYGGDGENRLSQEIVLGIGGVRALRALHINPGFWHINEGHSAFLCVERVRELVRDGTCVRTAMEVVRSSTLFTTHTPVPAGHDVFSAELIERYLEPFYREVGLEQETFLKLAWDPGRKGFNMTVLALRMSGFCNGVSRLHRRVTCNMFQPFFGKVPAEEVPICSVTNGIHTETFLAQDIKELFNAYVGTGWRENISEPEQWEQVDGIPDHRLWDVHQQLKREAIDMARENVVSQRIRQQESAERIAEAEHYLDPEILTVGFARRFATYKRAYLLFSDRMRLARLVNDPQRPVQFIFAGKAHPADHHGKEMIKRIYELCNEEPFRGKIVFLENYDISIARNLVQGVDVWLNTPRWPMEASGTSGMKAAVNGVLNFSVMDGWWPEAYNGENGFVVGSEEGTRLTEDEQDRDDSYHLYAVLENTIIPMFYQRENGLPAEWVKYMKESIKTILPVFSTERMVREYTENFYVPGLLRYREFTAEHYALAERVEGFKRFLQENWHHVDILDVDGTGYRDMNVGDPLYLTATVKLGPIMHHDVAVEVVVGEDDRDALQRLRAAPMELLERTAEGVYRFAGEIDLEQGTLGYTVRIRPQSPHFIDKFEVPLVTWAQSF